MKVEHFSFSHYYLSLFEAFAQGRMKLSSLNIDCNPAVVHVNLIRLLTASYKIIKLKHLPQW